MARKRKNSASRAKAEAKHARLLEQVRRRFDETRRASVTPPGARTMRDEEAWRLDELREEARYRRERLELYRARMYGGRAQRIPTTRIRAGVRGRLSAPTPS